MSIAPENVNLSAEQDKQLILNGYEPIPISAPNLDRKGAGQAPFVDGWRTGEVTVERMVTWRREHPDHPGTGFRTDRTPTVDLDIVNEVHWKRLATLAFKLLGETPLGRQGSKGIALPYRTETPISKITISHLVEGQRRTLVEILGVGQQFVGFGVHPKIKKPYQWLDDTPDDDFGPSSPLTVPWVNLPEVTPAKLRAFAHQAAALLTELGYQDVKVSGDTGEERKVSASNGAPVAPQAMRDALSYLDPNEARDEWRNIVAAIRAANVPGDNDLGIRQSLALEWSRGELDRLGRYKDATPSLYTGDDAVLTVFNTMEPRDDGITVGTLFDAAQAAGWQGSPFDDGKPASEKFAGFKMPPHVESPDTAPGVDGDGVTLIPFSQIKEERLEWIWPGRFPLGKLSILGGTPGDGKSHIVVDLAARLSHGGDLPFGEGHLEEGVTIILSAEDDAGDTTKPRLRAAGANMDNVLHLSSEVKRNSDGKAEIGLFNFVDDMQRVERQIIELRKQGRNVKLFIFDPISAFMGGRIKGDTWKNADVRYILSFLVEFARRQKIAVIGITHLNKSSDSRAIYRMLDSIAMVAASRSAWVTAKEIDDNGNPSGRTLLAAGRVSNDEAGSTLAYKIEGQLLTAEDGGKPIKSSRIKWEAISALTADQALARAGKGGNSEDSKTGKAMAFLLQVLADGPVEYQEVRRRAMKQKQAWRTVELAKTELGVKSRRTGGVGKDGKWEWSLPEEGDDPDDANDANRQSVDPDDEFLYAH